MTHEDSRKTLTAVQRRFVKEYPLDFNGTEAYLRASSTKNKKSASVQAAKLLKLPKIREALETYIEEQLGPQEKRLLENVKFWEDVRDGNLPGRGKGLLISREDTKNILEDEGFSEGDSVYDKLMSLHGHLVVFEKLADRMKASENLAKYSQMFVERHDVNVSGQVQIVDDIK